jgi:hypothetical protein
VRDDLWSPPVSGRREMMVPPLSSVVMRRKTRRWPWAGLLGSARERGRPGLAALGWASGCTGPKWPFLSPSFLSFSISLSTILTNPKAPTCIYMCAKYVYTLRGSPLESRVGGSESKGRH